MKNAGPVLGLEQGWQFGLEGLIFQIIEFHFDARVSAFESLGALLPDSPHLSLWLICRILITVAAGVDDKSDAKQAQKRRDLQFIGLVGANYWPVNR